MGKIYTFNNKIVTINNKWAEEYVEPPVDPYNPLGLPSNTVRVRTSDGQPPFKSSDSFTGATYDTATLVSGTSDVYDVYKSGTSFTAMLRGSNNVTEILGANTTGVDSMVSMFYNCSNLTTATLFDTSSVTNMAGMFGLCTLLTSIPLFDTSLVTSMYSMFNNCMNVQSGALALYQQASTQSTPPTNHSYTFTNCGINTVTGATELAQIPSSWGGTGA